MSRQDGSRWLESAGRRCAAGFSLIELVIVVVIIGIVAAIAIPRIGGAATSAGDSALAGDLAVLRKALDLYTTEHGGIPPTIANIYANLTLYSNADGSSSVVSPDAAHTYGPYLRAIPALSVGKHVGSTGIGTSEGPTIGWIYDPVAATIRADTSNFGPVEADASGRLYSSY